VSCAAARRHTTLRPLRQGLTSAESGGPPGRRLYERAAGLLGAGSDSLIVEGAGHWPHREDEDAFLARLIAFAGEVDQANGASR
jgi:pimeloyl-ACP methyl ester carboxylesterase